MLPSAGDLWKHIIVTAQNMLFDFCAYMFASSKMSYGFIAVDKTSLKMIRNGGLDPKCGSWSCLLWVVKLAQSHDVHGPYANRQP